METIAQLANKALTTSTRKSTEDTPNNWQPRKRTTQLFELMRTLYPRQWSKQTGSTKQQVDQAMRVWERQLAKFSGETIAAAADKWESAYPPNVKEFRALCKLLSLPPLEERVFKALPRPPTNVTKARAALKKMRACINVRFGPNRWQQVHGMVPHV